LIIPHTTVFGVLSGALSEAMEGVVSWVDPIRLKEVVEYAVDFVLSKRLSGKAEEGCIWLLGV
jgi:hypothetical protein